MLRERDVPGGIAPEFIAHAVTFCLDHDYHVILEGTLHASRYRDMIKTLLAAHRGRNHVFYLHVSLEETLIRHASRPQAAEFSAEDMKSWYVPQDLLGVPDEHVIPETSSFTQSLELMAATVGFPAGTADTTF